MTQEALIARLAALNYHLGRTALSKIETATRDIKLDDAVAIAIALGVPLGSLVLPYRDDEKIRLVGEIAVPVPKARAWWRGIHALHFEEFDHKELDAEFEWEADEWFFWNERSEFERKAYQRFPALRQLYKRLLALELDAGSGEGDKPSVEVRSHMLAVIGAIVQELEEVEDSLGPDARDELNQMLDTRYPSS